MLNKIEYHLGVENAVTIFSLLVTKIMRVSFALEKK